MRRLMLDIETLDNVPTAVILSIGAVWFDTETNEGQDAMHEFLPVPLQRIQGRTVSGDTLKWWTEQTMEAQMRVLEGRNREESKPVEAQQQHIRNVQQQLEALVDEADEIWANDPDFDCVILRDFMRGYEWLLSSRGWPFWKHRSVRTFKSTFKHMIPNIPQDVAHDALADAVYQSRQIMHVFKGLKDAGVLAAE